MGKSKGGLTNGGLSPKFSEKIGEILPGKSGLFGANWRYFRAYFQGLFGADRDQFLTPHSHGGRAEIAPKGPFLALFGPFRAKKPPFAKPPPPAVESSSAVEDAVENRSLYRVFVSRLFSRGLGHSSATIARLSAPKRFRTRRLRTPTTVFGCEIGRDRGLPIALAIAEWVL